MEIAILTLAGCATALATGIGAIPVSMLGGRAEQLRPALWGLTVGLMSVASVVGLLLPALGEGSAVAVAAGAVTGVTFLLVSRSALRGHDVHVGQLSGAGVQRSVLVFGVLLVHSLPEGFAIGTAFASDTEGLGLFVILAIALQNIPEGTATAIPMEAAGFSRTRQFWAAVLSSAPQPIGRSSPMPWSSRSRDCWPSRSHSLREQCWRSWWWSCCRRLSATATASRRRQAASWGPR